MIDPYGTHFPILAGVVARNAKGGRVVELGCGHFSTPMLHYMCNTRDQVLVTADTDLEWLGTFRHLETSHHEFHLVKKWGADLFADTLAPWGAFCVFVDCQPGEARAPIVQILKDLVRPTFIVVHDTEESDRPKHPTGANYGFEPVFATFKYRSDFKRYRPYTTVVSDFEEFHIEEGDREWQLMA